MGQPAATRSNCAPAVGNRRTIMAQQATYSSCTPCMTFSVSAGHIPSRTGCVTYGLIALLVALAGCSGSTRPAHTTRGFELGNRGAVFAARAEFVAALRTLAEGFDADGGNNLHSQALAAALRALDEADDFAPLAQARRSELDVATIARSHRTP